MSLSLCGMIMLETKGAWVPGRVSVEAGTGAQEEARTEWQREPVQDAAKSTPLPWEG